MEQERYVVDRVIWHWNEWAALVFIAVVFPFAGLREVIYKKTDIPQTKPTKNTTQVLFANGEEVKGKKGNIKRGKTTSRRIKR